MSDRRRQRPRAPVLPWALLGGAALLCWDGGAPARAGCAAEAPELLLGPAQMPTNGVLALVLTHPLWHSRRAVAGPQSARGGPLGAAADDLPFVLTRAGQAGPLRIGASQVLYGGRTAVEIAPVAGWVPGAVYELRADVGTQRTYPGFTAVAQRDLAPPAWEAGRPAASIVWPAAPEPEAEPPRERCVTRGRGKNRTTECSMSVVIRSAPACPPPLKDPYIRLRLPALHDDLGGALMLELRAGDQLTLVPAAREVDIGTFSPCSPANFPAPGRTPADLLVTPIDAARNRGATLRVPVVETPRPGRPTTPPTPAAHLRDP